MRVGDLRVFYDIETLDERVVLVRAVGLKRHNTLFIGGEEFEL
jgi:hypothetical protein